MLRASAGAAETADGREELVSIGGEGQYGSNGGEVGVSNYGNILTTGIFSDAIFAESVGGGGGSGAGAGGLVSLGGDGAGGGNAGNIRVENAGDINTTGWFSRGIVAHSIGAAAEAGQGQADWSRLAETARQAGRVGRLIL